MFTKLRIMAHLNHDAADFDTLKESVCRNEARLFICLEYLEANNFIVRELKDSDAEYYRRSYRGAFRDYMVSVIHPAASILTFLLSAAGLIIAIISLQD